MGSHGEHSKGVGKARQIKVKQGQAGVGRRGSFGAGRRSPRAGATVGGWGRGGAAAVDSASLPGGANRHDFSPLRRPKFSGTTLLNMKKYKLY